MIWDNQEASAEAERKPPAGSPPFRGKVRIRFRKEGPLRFIGHHDLMRAWERLLRRTGLPLRSSEGFHPKPRISSPLSLALGVEGWDELIEFELSAPTPIEEVARRIAEEMIDGLVITAIDDVPPRSGARVVAVEYACRLPDDVETASIERRLAELLAAETLPIERRLPGKPLKTLDARLYLLAARVEGQAVYFRLRVSPEGTVRPEEMIALAGLTEVAERSGPLARTRVELLTDAETKPTMPSETQKETECSSEC